VSALTDLSSNKIGDHTGERPLLVFASFFLLACLLLLIFHSLSHWVIQVDSQILKVH
jgi:hypothetical protein